MHFDWTSFRHWGIKLGIVKLGRALGGRLVLFEAFRRRRASPPVSGIGVLRVAGRHLAYVGREDGRLRLRLGFVSLA